MLLRSDTGGSIAQMNDDDEQLRKVKVLNGQTG